MLDNHHFIKNRRNGSSIYRADSYAHYMKIGDAHLIEHEVSLYQAIKKLNFPLPSILEYKIENESISWMKEESLKGFLYADVFTQDCASTGKIQTSHFDFFCAYQQQHLELQKSSENLNITGQTFDKIFNNLKKENRLEEQTLNSLQYYIEEHTKHLPVVRNHGDHNPYNIFVDGIIDLEDSFEGPLGYDTVTSLTQNFWFPISDAELTQEHRFNDEQIEEFLNATQDILHDPHVFGALFFMRAIFVTVGSDSTPLLETYRYQKLKEAINAILVNNVNPIDHFKRYYRTPA